VAESPQGRIAPRTPVVTRIGMALLTIFATGLALAAEPPRRIVSLNKCTDQLLLALVEPARIASVSPIGSDELSFFAE
jgi:iron complex transport system substrate-binding protein